MCIPHTQNSQLCVFRHHVRQHPIHQIQPFLVGQPAYHGNKRYVRIHLQPQFFLQAAFIFRLAGVYVSLLKTPLTTKERIFCMIAYMPKATVQAAIGSIPLALGLSCGKIVLTVAVLAILITAPLGAFGVDVSYKKLLLGAESDERDKTEV